MPDLNDYQKDAVKFSHEKPAVVTASAGSGKTTLLVERIIRLLSDRELGIRAESLAVMTFTRNATKSLREKLNRALSEKLAEIPSGGDCDEQRNYLSEQIFGLRQACISTIDSFCISIIRENPEAFDLPVNFKLIDDAKKAALQMRAVNAAMNDFYGNDKLFSEDERRALFYTFNFENDDALTAQVISTAEDLASCADAEKKLNETLNAYSNYNSYERCFAGTLKKEFFDKTADILRKNLPELEEFPQKVANEAKDKIKPKKETKSKKPQAEADDKKKTKNLDDVLNEINDFIKSEKVRCEEFLDACGKLNNPTFKDFSDIIENFKKHDAPKAPPSNVGPRLSSRKEFSEAAKVFQKQCEKISEFPADFSQECFEQQKTAVCAFVKLVRAYREYFSAIKKAGGAAEFSDCELMLLSKLSDDSYRQSVANRFSCIIVDEFQDSNDIQAEIFKALGGQRLFYVGDIKQSIYAFRGGNPDIMARLCEGEDGFKALPLNLNYRSREAVINTVNKAFSGLMTREFGGVNYKDGNALEFGAKFLPKIPDEFAKKYKSDIFFVSPSEKCENKDMLLARFTAKKIRELHDDENFTITKNGVLCRPDYSDFAILLRTRTKIDLYREALRELGIGSAAPTGRDFLDSEEVKIFLNFLAVLDNPLKSEELLKVMMSPVYRFTAQDAALIRLGLLGVDEDNLSEDYKKQLAEKLKKLPLYNCLKFCEKPLKTENGTAARNVSEKLSKLTAFLSDIDKFRSFANSNSLYRLICKIYEDTDAEAIVSAFEDSARRVANIRKLADLAADFESRDGGGTSDFLRFIERAKENRKLSVDEAARAEESAGSVSIMTFHGSKGLEVPVCILSELDFKMKSTDFTGNLLFNREMPFAVKSTDIKRRVKVDNPAYQTVSMLNRKKLCGEELRLLYVAMTRAQEKLIMIAEAKFENWKKGVFDEQSPDAAFDGSMPFKWVFSSLARYEKSGEIEGADCVVNDVEFDAAEPQLSVAEKTEFDIPDSEADALAEKIGTRYAFENDALRRAKFSVTEIAHKNSKMPLILTKPDFAQDNKLSGADKGNAYHRCMEFIPTENFLKADIGDYAKIAEKSILEMEEKKLLTHEEANAVEAEKIAEFFKCGLGQRMLESAEVFREQEFYAEIDGADFDESDLGEIAVQGKIDLYFTENGGIVLVDYKSDTAENLLKEKDNYAKQVKIYGAVLPELTGLSVREAYLYAFLSGEAVRIL